MIKICCDVCGIEINKDTGYYRLQMMNLTRTSELYRCLDYERDLCEECKKHIEEEYRYTESEVENEKTN